MMRRMIPGICLMLLMVGTTLALAGTAENTSIPNQTISGTLHATFGPFSNLGGTNKNFRVSGNVDVPNTNTIVEIRFLWDAASSAPSPKAASQWFRLPYSSSGNNQALDTGTKLLLGLCPQTVWVQVRTSKQIDTVGWTFEHTCNVTDIGQERIVSSHSLPLTSPWGLGFLGLALATVAAFVLRRSRSAWSASGNA